MIGLLKISKDKYIRDLLENGNLFFNTVDYFTSKKEDHRFDEYEGYDVIVPPKEIVRFEIGNQGFKVDPDSAPVKMITTNSPEYTHICCFTKIRKSGITYKGIKRIYHPRMNRFGDSLCIILDVRAFLNRVVEVINSTPGISFYSMKDVTYFPKNTYVKEAFPFMKRMKYRYQDEFRIALVAETKKEFSLKIGDLTSLVLGPVATSSCINWIENGIAQF